MVPTGVGMFPRFSVRPSGHDHETDPDGCGRIGLNRLIEKQGSVDRVVINCCDPFDDWLLQTIFPFLDNSEGEIAEGQDPPR